MMNFDCLRPFKFKKCSPMSYIYYNVPAVTTALMYSKKSCLSFSLAYFTLASVLFTSLLKRKVKDTTIRGRGKKMTGTILFMQLRIENQVSSLQDGYRVDLKYKCQKPNRVFSRGHAPLYGMFASFLW